MALCSNETQEAIAASAEKTLLADDELEGKKEVGLTDTSMNLEDGVKVATKDYLKVPTDNQSALADESTTINRQSIIGGADRQKSESGT